MEILFAPAGRSADHRKLCREPDTEPGLEKWLDLDRQYSAVWPNITRKKPAPPDADAFVGVPDKFAKYFSPNPIGPSPPARATMFAFL